MHRKYSVDWLGTVARVDKQTSWQTNRISSIIIQMLIINSILFYTFFPFLLLLPSLISSYTVVIFLE